MFSSRSSRSHDRVSGPSQQVDSQNQFLNRKLPPAFPIYAQGQGTRIEQSQADTASPTPAAATSTAHNDGDDDAEFQRALEESRREHENVEERERREKAEMDIVMEYAKKQSLAEEAFRQQSGIGVASGSGSGSGAAGGAEDNDDEDLRRATEESLRIQ